MNDQSDDHRYTGSIATTPTIAFAPNRPSGCRPGGRQRRQTVYSAHTRSGLS
jgi:hypothetical protein